MLHEVSEYHSLLEGRTYWYVEMVRCSVALLKICFGTETVAEGEGSWEAPPPLHPLPVLLTLAGEGRGEKLQGEGEGVGG